MTRHVLLLQGPCSYFFSYLGAALRRRGARVTRVLLCPGDWLFWRGGGGRWYRGAPEDWPGWIAALARDEQVTDMVCLGDGRRWHGEAIPPLRQLGVKVHVIEQGYLRPNWLTVEPVGTGGHTRFPADWDAIAALAGEEAAEPRRFKSSFANYAVMDVAWNLANLLLGPFLTPRYRPHSIDGPVKDWAGWIWKAIGWPRRRSRVPRQMAEILAYPGPRFLMALQLETDFQIRLHGPDGGLRPALSDVIRSFASDAPAEALLVIKRHPLDNGWSGWGRLIAEEAARHGAAARVVDLDGGDLGQLLGQSRGLITVNSTVGLTALQAGVPTRVLGNAIYDLPGLTHQGDMASFWSAPEPVDTARLDLFIRALQAQIQIPGNFDGTGAPAGAEHMAERILSPKKEIWALAEASDG